MSNIDLSGFFNELEKGRVSDNVDVEKIEVWFRRYESSFLGIRRKEKKGVTWATRTLLLILGCMVVHGMFEQFMGGTTVISIPMTLLAMFIIWLLGGWRRAVLENEILALRKKAVGRLRKKKSTPYRD